MSVVDALLLEPYRDPREVYIALRSDGLKGSGTINDPYDGGTRLGSELQASLTFEGRKFVLGTAFANALEINDVVEITGVYGPAHLWFNKQFKVIEILSDLHVMLSFDDLATGTVPELPPARPPAPPGVSYSHTGVIKVSYTPRPGNKNGLPPIGAHLYWPVAKVTLPGNHGLKLFDAVTLGNVSPSGYAGDYPIFGPKSPVDNVFACRLPFLPPNTSAPLNCTVTRRIYRYDEVMRTAPYPSAIHLGPGIFETRGYASLHVADNVHYEQLHTGCIIRTGQHLLGSGIGTTTLKLVLPLDEYNQTTAVGNPSSPMADYAEVADLTIDCNASGHVPPYGTFPAPVTCGAVGLRGNFINIRRVRAINFCTQALSECFAISAGTTGTNPAGVIEDCIVEQPGWNNTHETTLLMNNGDAPGKVLSPIVRHNYSNCNYFDPADDSRGSSEYLAVASIVQQNAPNRHLFTLTTKRPHLRKLVNNTITNNILLNGVKDVVPTTLPSLNQSFPVVQIVDAFQLVFQMLGNTEAMTQINYASSYIGVDFHAPGAFSGTGCVTEGNAVFDCPQAYYADTGSTRDTVVRDNYYSGINISVFFNFTEGAVEASGRSALSLTKGAAPNGKIATFEVPAGSAPLVVVAGDAVTITKALIGGLPTEADITYNGTFTVLDVIEVSGQKRKFTYAMKQEPTAHADSLPAALFSSRQQVRRLVYENNLCDFHPYQSDSAALGRGISSIGYAPTPANPSGDGPPFMFPAAVIRGNHFRNRDSTPGLDRVAFRTRSFENPIVEHNVIGLSDPHVLQYIASRNFSALGNQTPAGAPLSFFEDVGGAFQRQESLEESINDAITLSLI